MCLCSCIPVFLYLTPPPPGFPAPRPAAPGFPQLGAAAGSTARPYEVALECGGFKFYSGEAACTSSSSEVADLRRLLEESKAKEEKAIAEMIKHKKMKAEKVKDFKSLESDLMRERTKRKALERSVGEEKRKRLIAETEAETEKKKRRIAEEEFRKKRVALAAEKEINFRLETMMSRSCYSIEEGRQGAGAEGGWRGTGAMFTVGRSEPQGRSTATTTERRALEVSGGAMFTGGRSMVRSEAAAPESHAPEDGNGDVLAIVGQEEVGQESTATAPKQCDLEGGSGGTLDIMGQNELQGWSKAAVPERRALEEGRVVTLAIAGQGEVGQDRSTAVTPAQLALEEGRGGGHATMEKEVQGMSMDTVPERPALVERYGGLTTVGQGEVGQGEVGQGRGMAASPELRALVEGRGGGLCSVDQGEVKQGQEEQGSSHGAIFSTTSSVTLEYEEEDFLPPKIIRKKRPKKVQPVEEQAPPSGPFHLDEEKLRNDYGSSPGSAQHIVPIKAFPRREEELFKKPSKDKIPAEKNAKFQAKLFLTDDALATFDDYHLTKETYRLKYGEDFKPSTHLLAKGPCGATSRNMDTVASSVRSVKSSSWLQGFTWVYNQMVSFIHDKPEFRNFDWLTATAAEYDIILGYFWLWLGPQENGGALGHRYTTDSLKQIKTKIVNLTQHMLKRTDININSPAMRFCKSEMEAKRNKTAEEPMKENAGARKRVALEEEDRVKMDRWMTKPVDKVRIHLIIHSPYYPLTMLAIHHVLK